MLCSEITRCMDGYLKLEILCTSWDVTKLVIDEQFVQNYKSVIEHPGCSTSITNNQKTTRKPFLEQASGCLQTRPLQPSAEGRAFFVFLLATTVSTALATAFASSNTVEQYI